MFSSNTTQVSGGYEIQRSLRFNSADSAYLNRTPASAGNRKTWTWSGWVKRGSLGASQYLFSAFTAQSDAGFLGIRFEQNDNSFQITGWDNTWRNTTQAFRDVSAWYHVVVVLDTTQATADNRVRLYVNGVEVTNFTLKNNPSQNADLGVNGNWAHTISSNTSPINQFFNGYMTEVNFIDGQALTPSSFGEYNADTGVWQPKRYAGSYGTNGFYLNFSNNSNTTAATLGADYSGNGNNWTPNNFSVSAGAGNDSLVDVPTNFGVDTGVGGTVRGNYCTLNPLDRGPTYVLANGNLDASTSHSTDTVVKTTIAVNSGKWYAEVVYTTIAGAYPTVGIVASDFSSTFNPFVGFTATSYGYGAAATKLNNGSTSSYGATWTTGDVIGIAFDLDAGTITFYKNGVSQGVAYSGIPLTNSYCVAFSTPGGVNAFVANFGQRPFAYTAPSGFKALNTQNLPTPTIGATPATQAGKFFNPVLYTGNSSTLSVTGVGFQPDWTWIKLRSAVADHALYDVVRGVQKQLESNNTSAETTETNGLTAFGSDGFTVGTLGQVNGSGSTYVAWNWKANGAGVTNTAGTITSTVSANTTSGFSVVTYTGNGTSGATVGHGLGVTPRMIIVKKRDTTISDWPVYHASVGATGALLLNLILGTNVATGYWNNTAPTSGVFSIGNSGDTNQTSAGYVAYCFAEVPGYSRFGSWTGNGSTDGPFVFCGFRPKYILFKTTANINQPWGVADTSRSPYNLTNSNISPTYDTTENSGFAKMDILSNGFKLREDSVFINGSGSGYIFVAFAENPFKYSLAR